MATLNPVVEARTPVEEVVESTPVTVEVVEEAPIPEGVVTLSSGIRVLFKGKLPQAIAQSIVVVTFAEANVSTDGTVKDDLDSGEQLTLAKKIFEYKIALVNSGLAFDKLELYDELPKNDSWLRYHKYNPILESLFPRVDFSDPIFINLLYLTQHVFIDTDDDAVLQAHLLDQ